MAQEDEHEEVTAVHPMEAEATHRRRSSQRESKSKSKSKSEKGSNEEQCLESTEQTTEQQSEEGTTEEGSAMGDLIVVAVVLVILVGMGYFFYMVYVHITSQTNDFLTRQSYAPKPKAKHVQFPVELEQLYTGYHSHLEVNRKRICRHCAGTGMDTAAGFRTCIACQGTGVRTTLQQVGPFQQQVRSTCNVCHGRGRVANKHCSHCHGHGVIHEHTNVSVSIDPGMHHGDTITIEDGGDHMPRSMPSDLVVHLSSKLHPVFTRRDDDLEIMLPISLVDALAGFSTEITHLDQHGVHLKRNEVVNPTTVWRIPNEGMPIVGKRGSHGDLLVRFTIAFPERLSEAERQVINNLL